MFKSLIWNIKDTYILTKRNLLKYVRLPELLFFSTVQPVIFVMLFTYVFGGAIAVPGFDKYVDFLIPAIIVQTVMFGFTQTGVGLAEDLSKGLIDRFRSLPMSRSAVLAGRVNSDSIRNIFVVLLIVFIGILNGFKPEFNLIAFTTGVILVIALGFSFSWISATISLFVKDPETAQVSSFAWVFPLTFASSAFAPVETFPKILKFIGENSPVTHTIDSLRSLMVFGEYSDSIPNAIIWMIIITLIFAPLAIYRYKKSV